MGKYYILFICFIFANQVAFADQFLQCKVPDTHKDQLDNYTFHRHVTIYVKKQLEHGVSDILFSDKSGTLESMKELLENRHFYAVMHKLSEGKYLIITSDHNANIISYTLDTTNQEIIVSAAKTCGDGWSCTYLDPLPIMHLKSENPKPVLKLPCKIITNTLY